jgi:hypothetical protein
MQGAIQATIEESVSHKKITPYTKHWWSKELAGMRAVAHSLGKCSYRRRTRIDDPVHEEYRQARNRYTCSIKVAKDKCWEEWLKSVNDYNMWRANSYISTPLTDGARTRVPTLITKGPNGSEKSAMTNEEKTAIFETEFFLIASTRAQVDEDEHEQEYPEPKFDFSPITDNQIRNTIAKLEPYKAPDTDEFLNSVLIHCADQIVPRIGPLFRAVHTLRYWPEEWKFIGTIVLRKPGKDDYSKPGSHRPILLIKKLAMLYSKCISEDLLHQAEQSNMLAPTQFGFRPGRATTDAILYSITKIKDAWHKGKCTVMLFLDIKAAFPHIVISRLVHIMHMKGVPHEYMDWIQW